jgi:hypothetical protein
MVHPGRSDVHGTNCDRGAVPFQCSPSGLGRSLSPPHLSPTSPFPTSPSRVHLSVMSLEALDKLSSNIAELARLFACKLPATGPPHNGADGFNQTSELTEVAGKDGSDVSRARFPPRLLEKYAGAGRPNGQPRPADNTDSPLLTPGFSSVSFTAKTNKT